MELIRERLPLKEIATGSGDGLGLGPGYAPHGALGFILQNLRRFPGVGWDLMKVGLCSPVVRNQHMVINALDAWGQSDWPEEVPAALQRALAEETTDKVRERLIKVIAGKPLS